MLTRFINYLSAPIGGQILGLFRIIYSLFMAYEMTDYLKIDLVKNMFVLPLVNFKYDGLGWLTPLPEPFMTALVWGLLILSLMMASGIWFKWAARLFALGYAFVFFQDSSLYNNHIYLFILLAGLLSFTHADHFLSLRKKSLVVIPRWEQVIIQFQMVVVYFYAGVIKFNYDWLMRQEPVRTICMDVKDQSWLATVVKNEVAIYIITYGGVLLDIISPLLLWYKPARKWGIFLFMGFHLFNSRLFGDIGIFPFVMLAGLIIFYEPSELPWLKRSNTPVPTRKKGALPLTTSVPLPSGAVRNLLMGYVIFQLLFPLRGFFLPNPMDWTTIGNRFAWRVKADTRTISEMQFQAYFSDQSYANVNITTFVNTHQLRMLIYDPRAVMALANTIKSDVSKQGRQVVAVKAVIKIKFNGRLPQFFVDPDVDLTKVTYSPFQKLDWVMPISY